MSDPVKISATIITFNEEKKIEPCLQSLVGVADEIVVIDSCSTDGTEEICRRYPVKFISQPFQGYVAQKNFAMEQAAYDHVLSLDADERLSEELKKSIIELKQNWGNVSGYYVHRFNNYCGQWIRYAGWSEMKIRVWDRRQARWGGTDPHDFVHLPAHKVKKLKGDLLHYGYLTVDEHIRQYYKFAEIAARAKYKNGEKPNFIVNVVFNPVFRFVRSYVFQLGFLEGYYGFVICAISASQTFFKYLRLNEYNRKGLPEERALKATQEANVIKASVEKQ
jgi:glycosyltransferase involved in cell wall biosynthesis